MCHRHCIDGHNQDAQHHLRHFRHQVNRHHFLRTYPITASEHKYVKEAEKIKKYRYGGALVFHTLLPRYYFAWYPPQLNTTINMVNDMINFLFTANKNIIMY